MRPGAVSGAGGFGEAGRGGAADGGVVAHGVEALRLATLLKAVDLVQRGMDAEV